MRYTNKTGATGAGCSQRGSDAKPFGRFRKSRERSWTCSSTKTLVKNSNGDRRKHPFVE
jgi:hypothetical protein